MTYPYLNSVRFSTIENGTTLQYFEVFERLFWKWLLWSVELNNQEWNLKWTWCSIKSAVYLFMFSICLFWWVEYWFVVIACLLLWILHAVDHVFDLGNKAWANRRNVSTLEQNLASGDQVHQTLVDFEN